LALNSTEDKKKERLDKARTAYDNLMKYYPETKFAKEATQLIEKIDKELQLYKDVQDNLTK
ncbi:MAG: outer membrane protein assembly factor BamD, partial [Eudoraea sp.]|nr:outer membrane protein assembly factor BamD [Eudoraea sp.]